jgi:hypothetical protein
MFTTGSRCVVAGVRVLEQEAARRADSHLEVAVWGFSHSAGCGDILTSSDVGISSRKLGVIMARRTIEVRKPRDIGDAIRAVREARGISQEELAQANAYDRFYLYRLEAGRSTVYITRLLRTLKSLGITLSVTFDTSEPVAGDCRSDG